MSHRTRPTEPVDCDCTGRNHIHGTPVMYQDHRCGCDNCTHAYSEYRAGRRAFSEPNPETAHGLFVATFPYYGGYTRQRLHRILRPEVAALAEAQGVELLPGDPQIRIDRTGAGVFVVVLHPAESSRPVAEVRERAQVLAYVHGQAHPALARWIDKHLEVVA